MDRVGYYYYYYYYHYHYHYHYHYYTHIYTYHTLLQMVNQNFPTSPSFMWDAPLYAVNVLILLVNKEVAALVYGKTEYSLARNLYKDTGKTKAESWRCQKTPAATIEARCYGKYRLIEMG